MIYPKKLNSRKSEKIFNIFLVASIIIGIILVIVNKLTTPDIPWAALTNLGIIYIWAIIIYCTKKSSNIAGHILLHMICASIIVLFIDKQFGAIGWSISIAIPIILMTANITMLILTIVSYKKYIKYAIYQLIILMLSFVPCLFILNNKLTFGVLGQISFIVSILNLIITIAFGYTDLAEVIRRKLHM